MHHHIAGRGRAGARGGACAGAARPRRQGPGAGGGGGRRSRQSARRAGRRQRGSTGGGRGRAPGDRRPADADDARTDRAGGRGARRSPRCPTRSAQVLRRDARPNGLRLTKLRVPLGVVLIVYEARPNVTVDAAALCLKSGNACILRGSRLAAHTNRALTELIARDARRSRAAGRRRAAAGRRPRPSCTSPAGRPHAADVVIPRGGEQLKNFLLEHVADPGAGCGRRQLPRLRGRSGRRRAKALAIAVNAKVQRPGVCNAAETLLVHRDRAAAGRRHLTDALAAEGVELLEGEHAWATEFLDMKMAVRVVDSSTRRSSTSTATAPATPRRS